MNETRDLQSVVEVLGDETERRILALASHAPVSAEEIADHIDVSLPTVYRRVNTLVDYGFLHQRPHVDEEGNQYKVFRTALKRTGLEIEDGRCKLTLAFDPDVTGEQTDPRAGTDDSVATDDGPTIVRRSSGKHIPTLR